MSAFASIAAFEGRSALSTWLTRIVVNEALGRAAKRRSGDAIWRKRESPCSTPIAKT